MEVSVSSGKSTPYRRHQGKQCPSAPSKRIGRLDRFVTLKRRGTSAPGGKSPSDCFSGWILSKHSSAFPSGVCLKSQVPKPKQAKEHAAARIHASRIRTVSLGIAIGPQTRELSKDPPHTKDKVRLTGVGQHSEPLGVRPQP